MLVGLENRGMDATGMAILNPGPPAGLHVMKGAMPAWSFVKDKNFEKWITEFLVPETSTVLLHTRAATKGNPHEFENNHPMFDTDAGSADHQCAVVHNGVIVNDDHLFQTMNLSRKAETDSDILRAILDSEGFTKKGIRELSRVTGSVALAAVDEKDPEHLLLVRSGSPLVLGCTNDMLVWASEKKYIHSAMRPTISRFGQDFQANLPSDFGWLTMADNSAWLFGAEGKEWHDECKTYFSTYVEPRRHVYDQYAERTQRWKQDIADKSTKKDREALARNVPIVNVNEIGGDSRMPLRLKCLNGKCNTWNRLPKDVKDVDIKRLACKQCKTPLVQEARA
jgi:predicted glutamine amidotransferase